MNDTEDFINIDLDSHRNQLIEIDLMARSARASARATCPLTFLSHFRECSIQSLPLPNGAKAPRQL